MFITSIKEKKYTKSWHHTFYFLIDLVIVKSFILWQVNKRNRSLDQLTIRIAVARQLIDGYSSRKRKGCLASFQASNCIAPDDVRLASVENHRSKMISNYRRRCVKCSRKEQKKRTRRMSAEVRSPLLH
ncbi:piggyBac transposable element-derived protein 4 [Trichonephila clavipes]|nr:piggyBac transposable element-derived protein 4 [Trichonephila clavipes]